MAKEKDVQCSYRDDTHTALVSSPSKLEVEISDIVPEAFDKTLSVLFERREGANVLAL